jgi:hypothetical protein
VSGHGRYRGSDEQVEKVGGVYAISNGLRLEVEQTTRGMDAHRPPAPDPADCGYAG